MCVPLLFMVSSLLPFLPIYGPTITPYTLRALLWFHSQLLMVTSFLSLMQLHYSSPHDFITLIASPLWTSQCPYLFWSNEHHIYHMIIKGNTQLTQPLNPLWYVLFEHVRLDVSLPVYSANDSHIYLL